MKAVIGYFAVGCFALVMVAVAMKSQASSVNKTKSAIQVSIDARKAALDAL